MRSTKGSQRRRTAKIASCTQLSPDRVVARRSGAAGYLDSMEQTPLLRCIPLLAALIAALPGCTSTGFRPPLLGFGGLDRGLSQEELANELNGFVGRFAGLVSTAGEEIAATSDDPTLRRRALLLSLRMVPAVQGAAFVPNPRAGYVQSLTITVMLRYYLTTGDGRNLFGDSQPIAVSAAEALEADAYAIGTRFLTTAELRDVRGEVAQLAESFPIRGTQFSLSSASQAVNEVPSRGSLYKVVTLPLAPFRALQGVDTGAAAIRDFNQTAFRFGAVIAGLPAELRGEMQLLLLDADELRSVRQGLAAFELAAASGERASLAMERLPEELRATLDQQVRTLLEESQEPIATAAQAVAQVVETAAPLQETATQLRAASALWREILGPKDPTPRGPDERPFDVREWEAAVRTIGTSAAELRELAVELQGVRGALEGISLSAAVDRLFWRAVALLVVFFALLLVYRVLAARTARPPTPRA